MKKNTKFQMPHPLQYWFVCFFLWIIVDYTSTFMPHTKQWISLMPFIWIFYIGIPAIMAFVIYKFKLTGKSLFYATLIELVIAELLFQSDLFTIPVVFFMLPIAIVLYSLLTIVPFWIVEHKVVQNKGKVIFLVAVWLIFSVFRFFDQIG